MRPVAALIAVVTMLVASPGLAQEDEDAAGLRARQRALFERLLETPDDIDLMFDYAALSLAIEDFEAAIQTLERLLIYRQDLPEVRFQLGVAYFRLGAFAPSRLYFEQVAREGGLGEERLALARRYLDAITRRERRNRLSLVAEAGLAYQTNANLAPANDTVTIGGNPNFILVPDSREQDDFGLLGQLRLRHVYDLRLPQEHAWVTDATLFGVRFFDVRGGDTVFARLRTGPRLALGTFRDAPTVRPYVEGQYLFAREERLFFGGLGGVEFAKVFGDGLSGLADLSVGFFDFEADRDDRDRLDVTLSLGARYAPDNDLALGATLFGGRELAEEAFNSNVEIGARVTGAWRYDIGLGARRKWTLSGFADLRFRDYDEADPFIDPDDERHEVDLRLGLSNLFKLGDRSGVEIGVEQLLRRSPIQNFDLDNTTVTLSLQYRM